jgi:coiled-coil domain-containing protein 12|tara:strand:+ start:2366 stop:2665 length:300 start_codon:yes stop_codon:yes gene_type:complete
VNRQLPSNEHITHLSSPLDPTQKHPQIKARVAPEIEIPTVEPERDGVEDSETAVNVLPPKANADLKRDVERKLLRLEKKTRRAMIELTREEDAKRMASA